MAANYRFGRTLLTLILFVLPISVCAAFDNDQGTEAHATLHAADRFPSALECRECHPRQYREWAVSQHAYAQISPVFNAMHGTILKLTNGTNGDFCIRCHTPVGMNLGEPLFTGNENRHQISREGVTCISCHRVNRNYGKISGRLALLEGGVQQRVYGPLGNERLEQVLCKGSGFRVERERIHEEIEQSFYITRPGFCGSCHDVTLVNGFLLSVASFISATCSLDSEFL